MRRATARTVVVAGLALVWTGAAEARQGMQGSSQGTGQASPVPAGSGGDRGAWFGGGAGAIGQNLSASFSIAGGEFRREFSGDLSGEPPQTSAYRSLSGGLQYSLAASRATVSAGASSSASSFPGLQDERLVTYRGQVGVSFQLSSRTTLGLTQGLFYEPAASRYLRDIFGGGTEAGPVLPPDLDVGTEEDETLSQSTGIQLSHSLSARSSIAGTFTRWRSDYDDDDRTQAYDQGSIRYSHQLAEGLAARLGYAYGTGRSEVETDDVRTEQHLIDAGIDFNRALSLTRRTTLAFGTGTTMTRSGDESNFNVTGNVRLNHAIGRSWLTGFSYARDVRVVEGLTDLATTDRFSVDLGGSIGRRAAVNATGSYTRGRVGPEDVANAFEGMNGSAGLSIAATRNVGISVQYGYYRSLFDRTDFLLTPSVSDFGRHSAGVSVGFWGLVSIGAQYATYRTTFSRDQSVTASVSLFAPIFSRSRRPDAAR